MQAKPLESASCCPTRIFIYMELRIRKSAENGKPDSAGHEKANAVKIAADGGDEGRCSGWEVLVLDADRSAASELEKLLVQQGCAVRAYADLKELLDTGIPEAPCCLLLGAVWKDGDSGLEQIAELRRRNWNVPIVLMAKHWDIELVVDAMRAGADGFVPRPFESGQLLATLGKALEGGRQAGRNGGSIYESQSRLSALNDREREVVRLVVGGLLNKEIACRMGLALVTVKVYRSRAMKKLGAGNAAELAKITTLAGLDTDFDEAAS